MGQNLFPRGTRAGPKSVGTEFTGSLISIHRVIS
jgi:hypothetical protein